MKAQGQPKLLWDRQIRDHIGGGKETLVSCQPYIVGLRSARRFCERGTCSSEKPSNFRVNDIAFCANGSSVLLLIRYEPFIWFTINSLSEKHSATVAPNFFASSRARIKPVYSAKLFVAFPMDSLSSRTTSPDGSLRTAPIAAGPGFPLEAPSKNILSFRIGSAASLSCFGSMAGGRSDARSVVGRAVFAAAGAPWSPGSRAPIASRYFPYLTEAARESMAREKDG